ncbi:NAD+ synthase, partial [Bifidobacterium adolescentis]|nr:NAD+ synthase [Bifidobacterium adolescentis]
EPIKDLLKSRVWEISRWRNKAAAAGMGIGGLHVVGNEQGSAGSPLADGVMIPVNSIEKAPCAELRPGQK